MRRLLVVEGRQGRSRGKLGFLAVMAVALCFVGAGCGDDDKTAEFKRDYNRIHAKFKSLPTDLGAAVTNATGQSDAEVAAQFGELADRGEREVRALEALEPPSDARTELDAVVASLRKAFQAVRDIATGAESHDPGKVEAAARSLTLETQSSRRAQAKLKKAVNG